MRTSSESVGGRCRIAKGRASGPLCLSGPDTGTSVRTTLLQVHNPMSSPAAPTTDKPEAAPSGKAAVVKKYANRRLYNTATSSYVTLDELSQMVRKGDDFVVYDAKTNEDITRSVLTQIILEEDSKGRNLLPIGFLRHLIGYYDDSLQSFLPRYLELSMENFARHQDQMRGYVEQTFGRFFPMSQLDDMTRMRAPCPAPSCRLAPRNSSVTASCHKTSTC